MGFADFNSVGRHAKCLRWVRPPYTPANIRADIKGILSINNLYIGRMKKSYIFILIITLTLILLSCQSIPSSEEDIKLYTFDQGDGQLNQNNTQTTTQQKGNESTKQEYVRNEIVTEQNSYFSIGIPEKYIERTEVTAQKPVDFWFEFVPENMELKVNNQAVPRDFTKWETKLSYTEQVTKFNYEAVNRSNAMMSYYLRIVPSNRVDSVSITVVQHYQPIN